jgi:hypothetical protein
LTARPLGDDGLRLMASREEHIDREQLAALHGLFRRLAMHASEGVTRRMLLWVRAGSQTYFTKNVNYLVRPVRR